MDRKEEGGSFKPPLQAMSMLPWPQGRRGELYSPNLAKMLVAPNHFVVFLQGLLHRNVDFPDFQHLIFKMSPHESVNLGAKHGRTSTDGKTDSVTDTRQTGLLP